MDLEAKKKKYYKLCEEVKNFYAKFEKTPQALVDKENKIYIRGCDFCNELNLWTYWQGRGVYNPRIMVIGQDWGDIHSGNEAEIKEGNELCESQPLDISKDNRSLLHITDANKGFDELNGGTDYNLRVLFNSMNIGYDDIFKYRYDDLFFTNLSLSYRVGPNNSHVNITGSFKYKTWLTETENVFVEIIDLLKPQAIICLGQQTYEGLLYILGKRDPRNKGSFADFIYTNTKSPSTYNGCAIFAVSHTGYYGIRNMNVSINKKNPENPKLSVHDLAPHKEYWGNIAQYLNGKSQAYGELEDKGTRKQKRNAKSKTPKQSVPKNDTVKSSKKSVSEKVVEVDKHSDTTNQKANYYKASDSTKAQVNAFAIQLGNNDELIRWAKSKGIAWTEYKNQSQNIMRLKMAIQEAFDKGEIELK